MARGGRRDLSHVCLLSFGWTREPVRAWFLGFASSSWRGDRALGSQIQKGPTVLPATRRGFCLRVAASGPGTKDRRDRAWPLTASGTRAPLGGDGRWEVARLSWTSGLLSPPRPPTAGVGRRAEGGGARGTGAGLVTWRGARGRSGRGRALGFLKARQPSRERRLCGRRRRPGLVSETRSSGPPICAARCAWRWQRRSCTVKPPISPPITLAPWDPRRLGAPRAGDGIGDSRLLLRAAGGAAGGRRARHFWAAMLGRLGVRAGGAFPPAFAEQPARLSFPLPEVSLQGEFQRKLYKDLVKNYNPLERPVANDSLPLTVYFSLSLLQIMDVVSSGRARACPPPCASVSLAAQGETWRSQATCALVLQT